MDKDGFVSELRVALLAADSRYNLFVLGLWSPSPAEVSDKTKITPL